MSYRTVKRLLGETSLERKCLFLFGGGLMILITGSFFFYARLNVGLIDDQTELRARYLVSPLMLRYHWKWYETNEDFLPTIDKMADDLHPEDLPKDYSWKLISADTETAEGSLRPSDSVGYDALEALRQGEPNFIHRDEENQKYNYYAELRASKSCLFCHYHNTEPDIQEGKLLGMMKITMPLANSRKAVATNNAILLTTAIITACLAMLGAYAIVRYVIVKPVLHLKNVSDGIARGTLDLRADIRTGDEFEELSHAFNRMLRHLVTVQEELRDVNTDLDIRVDELAQVNLRLYEMNKIKDEFLATMSHELRTPLNSILGFSDVLSGSANLTDKQKRFLSNIQTSGRDLMRLIDDLLDLSKIESGKMNLQIIEFSLAELVEQQVALMMPMAAKKNIDLASQIDPGFSLMCQDAGKIQQILNNLLSNAIKFTPEGGRVRMRAKLEGQEMFVLIVEDSGIGIPLEEQELIFEKFRQGQTVPGQRDTMTREYGGTGLGLSIVKELSKLLGGEILLESEFGKGSTFTVRLPVQLDDHLNRFEDDLEGQYPALGHSNEQETEAIEITSMFPPLDPPDLSVGSGNRR